MFFSLFSFYYYFYLPENSNVFIISAGERACMPAGVMADVDIRTRTTLLLHFIQQKLCRAFSSNINSLVSMDNKKKFNL